MKERVMQEIKEKNIRMRPRLFFLVHSLARKIILALIMLSAAIILAKLAEYFF